MQNQNSTTVFFIEVDKIRPNPFQPRREFEEGPLRDLADSIRQYGILQPLVVSRMEVEKEDGGLAVEYELIAGERRLRASKLAGLREVPALIRVGDDPMMKLEIAIIENLQRENLNVVERARAFFRLQEEFGFSHTQIGKKVGKSREYVSNTLRILTLPQEILDGLSEGKLSEGHTRPLMMLSDRPEEQQVLFKEIIYKKISVREAERLARKVAFDKVRKTQYKMADPEIVELEEKFQETLGTRVHIEKTDRGGFLTIDFFSKEDLREMLEMIHSENKKSATALLDRHLESTNTDTKEVATHEEVLENVDEIKAPISIEESMPEDDRTNEEKKSDDTDLYNIKNFSL